MLLGLRVVRGPNWQAKKEDGGPGGVGTVIGRVESHGPNATDKVIVCWDGGFACHYRTGSDGCHDLRVLDNAPTGVKHDNIVCCQCESKSLSGIRWKCNVCPKFDLCQECYMGQKHNITHAFVRYDTPASSGVVVPKRQGSGRVPARGIFPGAKVARGRDWNREYEDGKAGKTGVVLAIMGWDTETARNGVQVRWSVGKKVATYRLGYKGKLDLQCVTNGTGYKYFWDHLPVLGKDIAISARGEDEDPPERPYQSIDKLLEHIYENEQGQALPQDGTFQVGDFVEIARDEDVHGGRYIGKKFLGRVGRVTQMTPSGDLFVIVEGETCQCSSSACKMVAPSGTGINTLRIRGSVSRDPLQEQLGDIMEDDSGKPTSSDLDRLLHEAAIGNIRAVQAILKDHPDKVDWAGSGKTALQVSSHQGHTRIVQVLLSFNANPNIRDDDGDTALHYAALRNQAQVAQLLLNQEANIDTGNNRGVTPLQEAVSRNHVECVEILLKYCPNVNHQNMDGDTALHIAVDQESKAIIQLLLRNETIDFTIQNKDGFNVLHLAARNGNHFATEKLLDHGAREIVNVKKPDGLSALHLAALNGKTDIIKTLIDKGQANINVRNEADQTPLHVGAFYEDVVALLVDRGADVDAVDRNGNTCFEVILSKEKPTESATPPGAQAPPPHGVKVMGSASDLVATRERILKKKKELLRSASLPEEPPALPPRHPTWTKSQSFSESNAPDPSNVGQDSCQICSDAPANVVFHPCRHKITCDNCYRPVRICWVCKQPVLKKVREVALE